LIRITITYLPQPWVREKIQLRGAAGAAPPAAWSAGGDCGASGVAQPAASNLSNVNVRDLIGQQNSGGCSYDMARLVR